LSNLVLVHRTVGLVHRTVGLVHRTVPVSAVLSTTRHCRAEYYPPLPYWGLPHRVLRLTALTKDWGLPHRRLRHTALERLRHTAERLRHTALSRLGLAGQDWAGLGLAGQGWARKEGIPGPYIYHSGVYRVAYTLSCLVSGPSGRRTPAVYMH